MELFLTSSVHAVAHDIAKKVNLSDGNKLVFIETAAEPDIQAGEDLEWLKNDKQALADAGFEVTDYTITNKTKEQLESDLSKYDFILALFDNLTSNLTMSLYLGLLLSVSNKDCCLGACCDSNRFCTGDRRNHKCSRECALQ